MLSRRTGAAPDRDSPPGRVELHDRIVFTDFVALVDSLTADSAKPKLPSSTRRQYRSLNLRNLSAREATCRPDGSTAATAWRYYSRDTGPERIAKENADGGRDPR